MKLSLRWKLMISYGMMALFLVCSLLLISNYMLEHHFQIYVQQKQERTNQNLVRTIMDEMEAQGSLSYEFLKRVGDDALDDGIVLQIFGKTGDQLYCAECENLTKCEVMFTMMNHTMRRRYADWQGEYTEQSYPLLREGVNLGTAVLRYYGPFFFDEEDQQFISMVDKVSVGVAAALFAAALALGAILAARIAKPIKHVIDRTHEIEQNRYAGQIDFVSGTREIDQLIGSVNTLAHTLEAQLLIKKRMAGDYAHEFRTPLAILQSNLEGMIDGILEASPERLESCRAEILRLSRMTSQIEKLVEIENNNLFLNKQDFDFSELLNQTLMPFEKEFRDKQITLKVETPSCRLYADKDKVSQVIVNLLSNALKYTQEGGRICVFAADHNQTLVFMVEDNGLGIEKEDLPYIFEYLYRTDRSRARGTGGSGIGLSVVKAIVTAHEGSIEVESQPGKGSRFTVTFQKQ